MGLLGRFGLLAAVGFVLLGTPTTHSEAVLMTIAGTLIALLGVEIAVLLGASSKREDV